MANRSATSRVRAREQSVKVGGEVKLARITSAMTRQRVANRAGVSWATEVRVELGDPHHDVETMCAVAEAVGSISCCGCIPASSRAGGTAGHAADPTKADCREQGDDRRDRRELTGSV